MTSRPIRLGIRANAGQFFLLVGINGLVGGMVGLERTVLPLLARQDFGIASASVTLSFLVAFGTVKAVSNLAAGWLSDVWGRKRLLIIGWAAGLPVAPMIIWAPSWSWIVAANVFLGVNQGLAWSSTVIMKIDLAGPRRRGLAMALNEAAGYGAVALVALVTGALAGRYGPRPVPFLLGIGISVVGLIASAFVRETSHHAHLERRPDSVPRSFGSVFALVSFRDRTLSSVAFGGFVNNLNDGMAWGLLPLHLASRGLGVGRIAAIAATYPAVWMLSQLATGPWSDAVGRKPMIVWGLALQAGAILAFASGSETVWWSAAVAMGFGTAMAYPSLLAAVGDAADPAWRASAVGVYRLWRDAGYVGGAILSGLVADAFGTGAAIVAVAAVTAFGAAAVGLRMRETLRRHERVG